MEMVSGYNRRSHFFRYSAHFLFGDKGLFQVDYICPVYGFAHSIFVCVGECISLFFYEPVEDGHGIVREFVGGFN